MTEDELKRFKALEQDNLVLKTKLEADTSTSFWRGEAIRNHKACQDLNEVIAAYGRRVQQAENMLALVLASIPAKEADLLRQIADLKKGT